MKLVLSNTFPNKSTMVDVSFNSCSSPFMDINTYTYMYKYIFTIYKYTLNNCRDVQIGTNTNFPTSFDSFFPIPRVHFHIAETLLLKRGFTSEIISNSMSHQNTICSFVLML